MLTYSESKRKRLTLAPRQFDLSADTVLQAAGLLRNPKYPSGQILEFLWLLTTKATLAANVDSFVSLKPGQSIYTNATSCTSSVLGCLECEWPLP
jgi:hypothetical protein